VPQPETGVLSVDEALRQRVARVARWNGGSILVVAGLGALLSIVGADAAPALFAAIIAYAGWRELAAGRALTAPAGDATALRPVLVRCELAVLVAIVGYSLWRLATADVAAELAELPTAERELLASLTAGDMALLEQLFGLALKITYGTLMLVTLAYQGGLAWWYGKTLRSTA
jgi:hypothetical protein